MGAANSDRIQKEIKLRAPRARVWRALTDSTEFGEWFGVRLEGPFQLGKQIQGQITVEGYDHLTFRATVERMEPETTFTFRWCPYAMDPGVDYSNEPTTVVEFNLVEVDGGTLMTLTESGFDGIPEEHRAESFIRNESGWTAQVDNIRKYIDG